MSPFITRIVVPYITPAKFFIIAHVVEEFPHSRKHCLGSARVGRGATSVQPLPQNLPLKRPGGCYGIMRAFVSPLNIPARLHCRILYTTPFKELSLWLLMGLRFRARCTIAHMWFLLGIRYGFTARGTGTPTKKRTISAPGYAEQFCLGFSLGCRVWGPLESDGLIASNLRFYVH